MLYFYLAQILCFIEDMGDADQRINQRLRAKRNPFARYQLDGDYELNKRSKQHTTLYPHVELRIFFFPEEVFKKKTNGVPGQCDKYKFMEVG